MNRLPPEPLTPEERELARLAAARAGSDGPPPALDAAILASARQAVAASQPVEEAAAGPVPQRQRLRWPVAMGLAASLLLAVAIAWQLRPLPEAALVQELPPAASAEPETATDAASPAAESAAPAPERQAQPMAAPASAPARDAVATQDRNEARKATPAPPPRTSTKPPRPAATEATATRAAAAAPKRVAPPAPPASPSPTMVPPLAPPVDVVLQPAKPAELRPAPAGGQFAEARAAGDAAVAFPPAAQEEGPRERSQRRALTAPMPMADVAAAPAQHERPALEPVEVAGTRLQRTDLHVPVSADSLLSQREWLERIRTRYGLGDPIAARQSLQLFVQRYPRAPVPEDLRPLLPPSP